MFFILYLKNLIKVNTGVLWDVNNNIYIQHIHTHILDIKR